MVTKILDSQKCSNCKYCCDFLPNETSVRYSGENYFAMIEEGIDTTCLFKTEDGFYTFSLEEYFTKNPLATSMACPYLDNDKGCILSEKSKPIACKLWPFMLVKRDSHYWITLATTCKEVSSLNVNELKAFAETDLKGPVLDYIKSNSSTIRTTPIEEGIDILMVL